MNTFPRPAFSIAIAWASALTPSFAALQPVHSPSAPVWNDTLDWSTTGLAFDLLPNPFSATSQQGMSLDIGSASGSDLERADEGTGWLGNFSPGEPLLYSGFGSPGPILISFNPPVFGAGAAFQTAALGDFSISIEVFDQNGASLGVLLDSGSSTQTQDGSARFVGFTSGNQPVGAIQIDAVPLDLLAIGDFAIGNLRLASPTFVPEASTNLSLILGALGMGVWYLRRSSHR